MASPIVRFYAGKTLFITGATGFVGKVLLERLLFNCPDIKRIYLLIRSKRGTSSPDRLRDFFQSDFWTKTGRVPQSVLEEKVFAIDGDITLPQLGINEESRDKLKNEVNVVFHVAASVRFDNPLKESIEYNLLPTKAMTDLCKEVKSLAVFVHVSTAYCYCHMPESEEKLYPMLVTPDQIIESAKWMPSQTLDHLLPTLSEGRPNTYTFTKALAEQYLKENEGDLTMAIVRPSIVTSTWKEPVAGWYDTFNGPGAMSILGTLGIARNQPFDTQMVTDMIPVDILCNAIITVGQVTAMKPKGPLNVYNVTSGTANPMKWEEYLTHGRYMAVKYPSEKAVRPPAFIRQTRPSKLNQWFTTWFSEILFAHLVDMILYLMGMKPMLVKVVSKMHSAFESLKFFTSTEWKFHCPNTINMSNNQDPVDKELFYMDIRQVDWREYCHNFFWGYRRYLLKEEDSNVSKARNRMRIIIPAYYLTLALFWAFLIGVAYFLVPVFYHMFRFTSTSVCGFVS